MPFHPRRNIKLEVEQLSRRAKRVEAMRPRISLAEHIAKFMRTVRRFGWALQFVGIRTEQLRPPPEANSQSYDRTAHYAEHERAAAELFKAQRCESLRRWVVRYRGLALTSHLVESGHDSLPMLELLHFVEPRYVSVGKFFERWDSVKPWLESLALREPAKITVPRAGTKAAEILQALHEAGAFSADTRMNTDKLAKKVYGKFSTKESGNIRQTKGRSLKGLVESVDGVGGGYWLTRAGNAAAETVTSQLT